LSLSLFQRLTDVTRTANPIHMKNMKFAFAVGFAFISMSAHAGPNDGKFGGDPACVLAKEAPADEDFGPLTLSVLGIESNLNGEECIESIPNQFSRLCPPITNGHFTGKVSLDQLEKSIMAAATAYPLDCHMPSYYYRLSAIYKSANQPEAADRMKNLLRTQYPKNTLNDLL